jgi:CheY-like chemotaxis protein
MNQPGFLYIEDDRMSRKVVEILLTQVMGFTNLTIFENSENLIERMAQLPSVPEVVLLDIQVRPHNGYEMLSMLRRNPLYCRAKIIALTANVMANDVEKLRQEGFDSLIGKPILKEIFPDLVKRILTGESVWYIP